ncbi:MAG: heme exporter protein CcmD [Paracoccaceae bacterium]
MMPDLGKYATAVLSAYGATIVLLVGLALISLRRAAKTRAELRELESGRDRNA